MSAMNHQNIPALNETGGSSTGSDLAKKHFMHSKKLVLIGLVCLSMSACGPSEKQKAANAERERIECLNTICQGDVQPERDYTKDELLKLNGQWFIGPQEYFTSGKNGGGFYWPSKTPSYRGGDYPEMGEDFYQKAIEIFLRGRARWPDPQAVTPWINKGWEGRFEELQKKGYRIERQHLRPDLERVRFFDTQGKSYRSEFFIATNEKKPLGMHVPGIGCDAPTGNPVIDVDAGCTGGFFWQPEIYVDFRLHAKHASDWPEIYQEIIRVLSLLKKA
ncbi:hypothetical protein KIK84_13705 [Curvibacter sp. CHRR-16]|uniref:hypothetical protein n=1 Tax=Curvibacter sp. CHRR-16 TaxID=2835872 RepID=UPI001BDAB489|nr:hypothetical protein [Curvibacter sp. CHRR-16]MBT0571385.1 hypothetical protein [Curvibacter sp. CHRR-16]